jgi:hypothetical protein
MELNLTPMWHSAAPSAPGSIPGGVRTGAVATDGLAQLVEHTGMQGTESEAGSALAVTASFTTRRARLSDLSLRAFVMPVSPC